MRQYDETTYGEHWAPFYRDRSLGVPSPEPTVAFVERLVGSTADLLDLGCGDGKFAVAMANRGHRVTAVDTSSSMLELLRKEDDEGRVAVEQASMLEISYDAQFDVVTILGLSLLQLPSQEAQLECLEKVARSLKPNGRAIIEGLNPDLSRYQSSQEVLVTEISAERTIIRPAIVNQKDQTIDSSTLVFDHDADSVTRLPCRIRYMWKSEMDLAAMIYGMSPVRTWANWQFVKYSGRPGVFISCFEKV
ncbi:class I SAM-dependent methyltransferase [Streptomyces sp. NPDC050988]|uniref:class I SAM-dependent methyltransferase n=1 Tax=Streptomyces sp. NPDC050988 TaxID=3365637 RepID=UPI0037900B6A